MSLVAYNLGRKQDDQYGENESIPPRQAVISQYFVGNKYREKNERISITFRIAYSFPFSGRM
jgi:hypothetical protein